MKKSTIWLWSFYDFANSLAGVVVSFYFSLFIVNELHKPDTWVSVPVALATLSLLLTLPFLGSVSDKIRKYKPSLYATSMLSILVLILLGIACQRSLTQPEMIFFVGLLYFLFQYLCQAALAFYLPFIQSLSKAGSRDFVASLGMAAGQLGNVAGLMIAFPIAASSANIFGLTKTPLVFCVGALLFLVCFLFFNANFKEEEYKIEAKGSFFPRSFAELFQHLGALKNEKNVLRYLIAYHLFADAILTLQLFASLYMDKVGHMDPKMKTAGFVAGVFTGIIGAMLTPWFNRVVGNLKKAILILILVWSLLLIALANAMNPTQMILILALNGFAFGALFSLARVMYSKIIPPDEPAQYFGIFVIFERVASIVGPLLWSFSAIAFAFAGDENKYRFAIGSLALLVLISWFVLKGVKEEYRS